MLLTAIHYLIELMVQLGNAKTPGRVWKGKKMSGQMGNERKTIQNLKLVKPSIIENNLLFVKGAVPGPTGSILKGTKSVKTLSN